MIRPSRKYAFTVFMMALAATAVLLGEPSSVFGQKAFVKFDGIDGESTDREHRGWIEAIAYSDGLSPATGSTATLAVGRSRDSRAAPKFENIEIVKHIDKASLPLRRAAAESRPIKGAEIDLTRPVDGNTLLQIELQNVRVTGIKMEFSGESVRETVRLTFRRINYTYTEYDSSGKPKGDVTFSWDTQTGTR